MLTADIRNKFLQYFEKHGHQRVASSSLVPHNDPTLLFTNAGMNQFKDLFLGQETRAYKRAVSSQKCVRAGGKHNDLENVGFTARHHTFFEMLGNFSFGDYFKQDAIRFAWDFVCNELKISKDKLYVTVFQDDDEAAEIWHAQEKVPRERIFRLGAKDNFWQMGDTGPCGPCSEIFVDRGAQYGCGAKTCAVGCDCDRYMEIWNLVFMQYDRQKDGKLVPLPKPSVDTGSGLERLAAFLQGVDSNYDIDIFKNIIDGVAKLAGKKYEIKSESAASFRVIADHARATTFLIADGVMPSNEGRGYVLRRIMRRAVRHGRKLGFSGPFLHKACGFVIDAMVGAFPELADKRAFVDKVTQNEEELFFRTLENGLGLLDEATSKIAKGGSLPGAVAFKLYDTFGFPLDLTRTICAEKGLGVDEAGFEQHMAQQKSQSRKNWVGSGEQATSSVYLQVAETLRKAGKSVQFVGYDAYAQTSPVLALIAEQDGKVASVAEFTARGGEAYVEAVFAVTPFYAEGGGQVGDHGQVRGGDFAAEVVDVRKPAGDMVVVRMRPTSGAIKVGASYEQLVDRETRLATARNHTATHMLHWALRKILGDHVKQAGSLVNAELLRFDFAHFAPLTRDELRQVEDMVNERIWQGHGVVKKEMPKDDAVRAGAIAFFGEKYGERVRVVSVGDFSVELCGGTHVSSAGEIHLFKIASEAGIASGVRRIIAYTGPAAFAHLRERDEECRAVRDVLKAASGEEVQTKLAKQAAVEKDLRRQIDKLHAAQAGSEVDAMLAGFKGGAAGRYLLHECGADPQGVKKLRDLAEQLKQKVPDGVAVLAMQDQEAAKVFVLVSAGPQIQAKVSAADVLKTMIPHIDGRGGGKADMAQAGGTKLDGLPAALAAAGEWLQARIS